MIVEAHSMSTVTLDELIEYLGSGRRVLLNVLTESEERDKRVSWLYYGVLYDYYNKSLVQELITYDGKECPIWELKKV